MKNKIKEFIEIMKRTLPLPADLTVKDVLNFTIPPSLLIIILFVIVILNATAMTSNTKQIYTLTTRLTALEQEVDSVKDTQIGIVTWAGEVTREVNSNTAKLGQDGVYYQLTAPICYECHR